MQAARVAQRMGWEARQAHQSSMQASRQHEVTQANRQTAALEAQMAAMQATPEEQPEVLAQYAPQLEEAVLKGASLQSVSNLMRLADRAGQGPLDPATVAKKIQAVVAGGAVDVAEDATDVTYEELHVWSKMGDDLDAEFISGLKDDVK